MADLSTAILAAAAVDTVKLFDVSVDPSPGDPCILSYSPSPGFQVNSVKWNHTNLVVASAGDDKKISLWRKSGQSMGTIPLFGSDNGDSEESIMSISFSNKGSRYLCSGGTGRVVKIWDLQRKRCIKRLSGHGDTITGATYNCKDEYLASISLRGDLILHNLASGTKVAELKDPDQQVLRVLDYSRNSRHLLVTAGDDGSVHLWDTTSRSPKTSWLKQHTAPTVGVSFSPSNDKIIASVGLDKKLYTFDSGARSSSFCISYEVPFSSLALRDDGWILAAGTSNGRVVFYDIRGKPQPFTVLHAYSSSEAVTSLCWERSKPIIVNEGNCTSETALLGGAADDSVLMPDPLPSVTSSTHSLSNAVANFRTPVRTGHSKESPASSALNLPTAEETQQRNYLRPGGVLTRLHAPRSSYNFKDDMEVFSPLVDVEPITPSLEKFWDDHGAIKKENQLVDKKPSSMLYPSSIRRFPYAEDGSNDHPIFNWKSSTTSEQDDTRSSYSIMGSTPSSNSDEPSITPPEAWGGEKISDKFLHHRQGVNMLSRFSMLTSHGLNSGTMFSGVQDLQLETDQKASSLTGANLTFANLRTHDVSSSPDTGQGLAESASSSISFPLGSKSLTTQVKHEALGSSLALPRKISTYAERISSAPSNDAISNLVGSPKTKKTGLETKEERLKSLLSRSDTSAPTDARTLLSVNGGTSEPSRAPSDQDPQQGASFTLQLFQRTLDESLACFQDSIHADVRNLHIEVLRQFHIQETEMSTLLKSVLENQAELMKEVQLLRKENQLLRQLL